MCGFFQMFLSPKGTQRQLLMGICLCLWLLSTYSLEAQRKRGRHLNLQHYDSYFLHYGIILGVHTTRYNLQYSSAFNDIEYGDLHSIHSVNSPGFKVGVVLNGRLTNHLDLRLLPTFSLYENRLEYNMLDGSVQKQARDYSSIELPLLLKLKSNRRNNTRMYLVAGVSLGFEASKKKDIANENNLLRTKKTYFSAEVGVGVDVYLSFFKLSPEFRYSRALNNVLSKDNNYFDRPLKSLMPNTFAFYLTFEGGAY